MRTRCIVLALLIRALAPPEPTASAQTTHVLVNRRELRVDFPRDTAHVWGWLSPTARGGDRRYVWRVDVNTVSGPQTFSLDVARTDTAARNFSSLDALVTAGKLWLCGSSPGARCKSPSAASASVDNDRVVLRLHDSLTIASLFGLRPTTVRVQQETPRDQGPATWTTVSVTYTAPEIPQPNAELIAQSNLARSPNGYGPPQSAWRSVRGGLRRGDTLSLAVGEAAALHIEEGTCHYDVCVITEDRGPRGTWTVDDTSIVTVALTPPDSVPVTTNSTAIKATLTARRAGHTTLRVKLPVPVSENLGGPDPANTTIELPVVVVGKP